MKYNVYRTLESGPSQKGTVLIFPDCDKYARGAISKEASFTSAHGFRRCLLWWWRTWWQENLVGTACLMAPWKHRDNRKVSRARSIPHGYTLSEALPPTWPQLWRFPLLPNNAFKFQIYPWVNAVIRSDSLWSSHVSMTRLTCLRLILQHISLLKIPFIPKP